MIIGTIVAVEQIVVQQVEVFEGGERMDEFGNARKRVGGKFDKE